MKLFRKEKENPPLPRHFPPISGRIKWARALQAYVEELAKSVSTHPVLKNLPAVSEVMRKYNSISSIFKVYEEDLKNVWNSQEVKVLELLTPSASSKVQTDTSDFQVWVINDCLKKKLLIIDEETNKLQVNLDFRIKTLIREADCLVKMDIPVPPVTLTLLSKRDYFTLVSDSLQVVKIL